MKTAYVNINLVASYFTLLKNLSPNNKLELIARLSKTMKTRKAKKDTSWESLFGAWELDQSTDEFIEQKKGVGISNANLLTCEKVSFRHQYLCLLLNGQFNLMEKVGEIGFENCVVSELTIAELKYGVAKSTKKEKNQ